MSDAKKTKSMLIQEVKILREKVRHLEKISLESDKQGLPPDQMVQLYRLAIEEAPVSIWACDRNWRILYWNPGAEKIYLSKREDVLGKSFLELFVSDRDRDQAIIDLEKVFNSGIVEGYQADDRLPDGTTRRIHTITYPIYDDAGNIYLQAEIGVDMTEQERSKKILQNTTEIGRKLMLEAQLSEREILEFILSQISTVVDTSNMYIALFEEDESRISLGFVKSDGKDIDIHQDAEWQLRNLRSGLADYVIRTQKTYNPPNVKEAHNTNARFHSGVIPKSWIGIPLIAKGKIIGVIVLYNNVLENCYSEQDQLILQTIADYASIAIQNTRLYQQFSRRIAELEVQKGITDKKNITKTL